MPSTAGSRLGLTARETPSSVSIVDRATIESRGAQTTQEVVQRMPGVIASDPPGSAGSISLRGFSGTSVTQMFNGISLQYDVIAARPVDSWLYDRVELLGGASSYLYGQGAVGGAVNYVSKIATRGQERNEAMLMGGMWFNRRASYGINKQIDPSNWLQLDVSYKGSDGYMENSHHNSGAGSVSWLTDIAPGLSNTIAVEFQSEQRNSYWGTPIPRPSVGNGTVAWGTYGLPVLDLTIDPAIRYKNYNARSPVFDQQVLWVRDIAEYELDGETRFKNTFYLYRADRQYQNVETYRYNATNTAIDRSGSFATRHIQSLVGDRLEALNETKLFGLESKTVAGIDYSLNQQTRNSEAPNSGTVDTVDPYGYSAYKLYQDNPAATGYVGGARSKLYTLALFAENRLSLTPQLHLVTGLRWEKISLERFNFRTPTAPSAANPFGDPAYFGRGYEPFTWRAALMYDLTKETNVYVSYSTAADPPSGILLTNNAGGVRNFDLTTGWQVEAGLKTRFLGRQGIGDDRRLFHRAQQHHHLGPRQSERRHQCRQAIVERHRGQCRRPAAPDSESASQRRLDRSAVREIRGSRVDRRRLDARLARGQSADQYGALDRQWLDQLGFPARLAMDLRRALRRRPLRRQRQHHAHAGLHHLRHRRLLADPPAGAADGDGEELHRRDLCRMGRLRRHCCGSRQPRTFEMSLKLTF